ncbi:hypothetical protein, partial [Xylanibacter rodentium]|uniref:hypothetical protein n=1 Tax=Xylanibacter rodentium TaxID=2736289 RepID=UPI00258BAAA5
GTIPHTGFLHSFVYKIRCNQTCLRNGTWRHNSVFYIITAPFYINSRGIILHCPERNRRQSI